MRSLLVAALFMALPLSPAAQTRPTSLPSFAQPALSPDGKEIAFASGGDIWTAPSSGGDAHLLISDPADESRPLYSPDGTRLAFVSTRTGAGDIYILTFATGTLQRITFSDSASNLDAWSRDGQWIYFTSSANDVAGQGDILRVRATGGTPLEVSRERYMNEFESAPSPDGKQILLAAKGISSGQWWRNGHAHIDETELWLKPLAAPGYKLLIPADAKHAWPMWSADGHTVYFMSDKSGHENIWQADATSGDAKPLTHFTSGRCLWPSISYDGHTILFERHFAIWKLDTRSGKSEEVKITLHGVPSAAGMTHTMLASWSGLALSPDGKKIAVAAHGDIFAASAKDGGEPRRLTRTESAESNPQWSPDSNQLVYLSERDGGSSLYLYDFNTNAERALTHGIDIDGSPVWSPDGKSIAFLRNRRELRILTPTDGKDRLITTGEIDFFGGSAIAWSPDSKWLVYLPTGTNGFSNLAVVPAAGGESRPITFLANGENASHIAWSPDGKYIIFDTSQRAETPLLARVDLVPHVPSFREDQFNELFRKQVTPGAPDAPPTRTRPEENTTPAPTEPKPETTTTQDALTPTKPADRESRPRPSAEPKKIEPTRIVFEGIRERLTLLPLGDLNLRFPVISPDGKTLAFLAEAGGQQNIYTYSLDELSREPASPRQQTSGPGAKSNIAFTPDSKEIYYLEGGGRGPGADAGSTVHTYSLDTHTPKNIMLATAIDIDFDKEKQVVFDEAWNTLNHRFVAADFNGQDWAALKREWQPYIAGTRTGPELRRDISLLIGELNSSHSGISKPSIPAVRTGRLGLRFEREPFESSGQLIIREIVPLGPAATAHFEDAGSIHIGDRLLAVDGTPITRDTSLDSLLEDRTGHRTVLSIESAGKKHDAIVRPITLQVESGLLYRAWVADRRAYVEKISNGKLGYVHIAAMGDSDLAQLYLDLDVQNQSRQGVVIDVRNNNGGYVNGRVIDVFSRKNYLTMTPRDGSTAPSRQALGQRALGLPTVLVTNESTLSDGEDFTEGYRTLGLGKVVGTPTAGWIIFTGAQRLIDGSSVRVPGDRIKDTRGQDMEMHPRPVDIEQARPLGETETGHDIQLEKAVQTLLGELK